MTYSYGDEIDNTSPPQYQYPDLASIIESITGGMGGPPGMGGVLDRVRNLPDMNFMDQLPWGQEQIGQWMTNKFSGKGAAEKAGVYGRNLMDQTNRTFTGYYDKRRAESAATGGRGSSGAAKEMVTGVGQLAGARTGVEMEKQRYEDELRARYHQQGMGALTTLEGIQRGDWNQSLQSSQLLLNSLAPEMGVWSQDQDMMASLAELGLTQSQIENLYNQWLYEQHQSGGVGAGYGGPPINIGIGA